MLNQQQLDQIVSAIYQVPELFGVAVGHYADGTCRSAHPGVLVSVNFGLRTVIIEETGNRGVAVTSRSEAPLAPPAAPVDIPAQAPQLNSSRVGSELLGTGLSCGAAVISGIGVLGSAAAEVPSAGTSTFLLVASWAGLITSGAQCLNGIVRSVEVIRNPDDNSLERWDNNRIYSTATFIVDAIGVASAVASLPAATRNLIEVLRRQRALVLTIEELRAMNAAGRSAAIRQAVEQASRNPESARVLSQALREAGIGTQTLARGSLSVRNASRSLAVIRAETLRRVHRAVMEVLGGVAGPGLSATPSRITGSASGSVNTTGGFLIHLVTEG